MNQQDELERLIRKIDETTGGLGEWHDATEYLEWVRKEVQRILNASRPRVVETVADLDDLPKGSVVITEQGGVYEAGDPGFDRDWWETGQEWTQASMDLALPATVLYLPEEKP
ncbi:hypothetical protein GS490_13485 [Rhodococcus hoagii]|nr:hypothetical protein [Prescottella equi]